MEKISLKNNHLNGTIPLSLFTSNLQYIDISGNYLTGTIEDIPSAWDTIVNLDIGYNKIHGRCMHNTLHYIFTYIVKCIIYTFYCLY